MCYAVKMLISWIWGGVVPSGCGPRGVWSWGGVVQGGCVVPGGWSGGCCPRGCVWSQGGVVQGGWWWSQGGGHRGVLVPGGYTTSSPTETHQQCSCLYTAGHVTSKACWDTHPPCGQNS